MLSRLLSNPIYELIPLPRARDEAAALPDGASVTVTASPRLGLDATLDLAEWLAAQRFDVAPHLAARAIRDRAHLAAVLERMQRAGIRKLFVVGGDGEAVGDFRDGLSVLRAINDMTHPFDEVGVPAYPEGHSAIPGDVLLRDLRDKERYAHAMTTQMSFNPAAVAAWITRIRHEGISLPIHLGIPGAVELHKLGRIATRIGVGDSMRYLMKHRSLVGHLLHGGSFGADAFLTALAPTLADPTANVRALHVFTMNQVAATVAWQHKMLEALSRNEG